MKSLSVWDANPLELIAIGMMGSLILAFLGVGIYFIVKGAAMAIGALW